MRLAKWQIEGIVKAAEQAFAAPYRLLLFGSRLQDDAKGGDIDLLLETDQPLAATMAAKIRFLALLDQTIGEQQVDLVLQAAESDPERPIVKRARKEGVELCRI